MAFGSGLVFVLGLRLRFVLGSGLKASASGSLERPYRQVAPKGALALVLSSNPNPHPNPNPNQVADCIAQINKLFPSSKKLGAHPNPSPSPNPDLTLTLTLTLTPKLTLT